MGVAGLWDILRPSGKPRSLVHLGVVDGFQKNLSGKRGYRVGIDASIWFFHAEYGREGENPQLRTLFFRLARLLEVPLLPLFVFDGPHRPAIKRGHKISGNSHKLTGGMKKLIDAFGFEWRQASSAPGEAEAELAYLNQIGVIDAVLSDDVDTFLFGAKVLLRNPSATLSGNRANPVKNADGRDDGKHVVIYRSSDICEHDDIRLTRGGLILMGLLMGGDYQQEGLRNCGKQIAHGLARCGYGDDLVKAVSQLPPAHLPDYLDVWREAIRTELRTNSRGIIGKKHRSLADSIPDTFPDMAVLEAYINPVTSARLPNGKSIRVGDSSWWTKDPNLADVAGCCELYFEWGIKETILKRFRTVVWPGVVLRVLRRGALEQDAKSKKAAHPVDTEQTPRKPRLAEAKLSVVGTPSKLITKYFSKLNLGSPEKGSDDEGPDDDPLMVKIHSTREHASTDGILEYRVEIAPSHLVALSEPGIQGLRQPENKGIGSGAAEFAEELDEGEVDEFFGGGANKAGNNPDPSSHIRVWLPACMMDPVQPALVEAFHTKKASKATKRGAAASKDPKPSKPKAQPRAAKTSAKTQPDKDQEISTKPHARKPTLPPSTDDDPPLSEAPSKGVKKPLKSAQPSVPSKPKPKPKQSKAARARHVFDSSSDEKETTSLSRASSSSALGQRHLPPAAARFLFKPLSDSDDNGDVFGQSFDIPSRRILRPSGSPTSSFTSIRASSKSPVSFDDRRQSPSPTRSGPRRTGSSSRSSNDKGKRPSGSGEISQSSVVTVASSTRRRDAFTSGSEDACALEPTPRKSPKKNTSHISPSKRHSSEQPKAAQRPLRVAGSSKDDPKPLAGHKCLNIPPKSITYIEISSDEDVDAELPTLIRPRLIKSKSDPIPQMGAVRGPKTVQKKPLQKGGRKDVSEEVEIIDLT